MFHSSSLTFESLFFKQCLFHFQCLTAHVKIKQTMHKERLTDQDDIFDSLGCFKSCMLNNKWKCLLTAIFSFYANFSNRLQLICFRSSVKTTIHNNSTKQSIVHVCSLSLYKGLIFRSSNENASCVTCEHIIQSKFDYVEAEVSTLSYCGKYAHRLVGMLAYSWLQ